MKNLLLTRATSFCLLAFLALSAVQTIPAQKELYDKKSDPSKNRNEGLRILNKVEGILEEYYFDPNYKGIDLKKRVEQAREQIKTQEYRWQIHRTIAQVLLDFDDSHTSFLPPDRLYRVEYGFSMMIIGNDSFVTDVKKGSDAEKKGLSAGDKIENINGIVPNRGNFRALSYLIYSLDPQENIKLNVVDPNRKAKDVQIVSRFLSPEERAAERRKRKKDEGEKPFTCLPISAETLACKLRTFSVSRSSVDKMMKAAQGYKKLVLDLRGNGGGLVDTEMHLTGYFFDKKVKIGTEVMRKSRKERFSNERSDPFTGELFVLVDSQSASASEVFARTMQLEGRGKVIGDTSMGAVMTSYQIPLPVDGRGASFDVNYGASRWFGVNVTIGDLLMSDGKSLEHVGVTPDHRVGPTPIAVAQRNDPVLAFAAELAGSPMTPEKAGTFNFFVPKAEEESDKEGDGENK